MSDMVANSTLKPHIRPAFFAANELLLELILITQSYAKTDLDTLLVILCVGYATMKPFMHESNGVTVPTQEVIEESKRGSISRRQIADKTGLPRESVRRKVDALVQAGLLIVDHDDRLRSAPLLGDPDLQLTVEAFQAAVHRYQERLSRIDFGTSE